ncbi:MAG: hypothetical protein V4710_20695 [Verrucomicrobiota bacterium]
MNKRSASQKKAFWARVEAAGEGLEVGVRFLLGCILTFVLCFGAYEVGCIVAVTVGVMAAIITFPFAFGLGFFWPEVKFLFRLVIHLIFGF